MMNWKQSLLLAGALGALPALSGCIAAVVPVAAASMAAKKRIAKRKAEQQRQHYVVVAQPDAPGAGASSAAMPTASPAAFAVEPLPTPVLPSQRVAIFAGEGSTRATLAPSSVVKGQTSEAPAPRLYTVTDGPAKVEPAQTPTLVTLPASTMQAQFKTAPVMAPRTAPAAQSAPVLVLAEKPAPVLSSPTASSRPPQPAFVPAPAKPVTALGPALIAPAMGNKSSGYPSLAAFAISHANSPQTDSALDVIDPNAPLSAPHRAQCGGQAPAVMIDLDPGLAVFDPAATKASPGLAEALAALRAAGITVLWTSALPVEKAEIVHTALARTQLDPMRTDRLLLLNGAGDRKQARRNSAAHNWCVIAMAGDRRGDFDEAFD
ncbi:MAG: hypothetical protein ABIW31_02975, partial [Novosphingobium sp.]